MARGKRTSEETRAKVVELKMQNPELSSHDIEKLLKGTEFAVSNETVCDIIAGMAHLGTKEAGAKQIERLDTIISDIEEITAEVVARMKGSTLHTIQDVKALNDIAKVNFDRKQLLTGKPTENINVGELTPEQKEAIAKRYAKQ